MNKIRYRVECKRRHKFSLSPDRLEEVLNDDGNCPRKGCEEKIALLDPTEIHLTCTCCHENIANLDDALMLLFSGCQECADRLGKAQQFHVDGSTSLLLDDYDFRCSPESSTRFLHRPDYWEYVTHFCSVRSFASIMDSGTILARRTGYFRKPAICLTDIPLHCADEIRNRRRHGGPCGFVFKKSVLAQLGLTPAIYLSDTLLQSQHLFGGFADPIKPFINVVRDSYNYLREREWRVPVDIDLRAIQPFRVILPKGASVDKLKSAAAGWLISASIEFGELE